MSYRYWTYGTSGKRKGTCWVKSSKKGDQPQDDRESGKVCAASPSSAASGDSYSVESISRPPSDAMVVSPQIMAGFLDGAGPGMKAEITRQLAWMRSTGACMYTKRLISPYLGATKAVVPWRCSLDQPNWRAATADAIDFSTMVLGYASLFLQKGFYGNYSA